MPLGTRAAGPSTGFPLQGQPRVRAEKHGGLRRGWASSRSTVYTRNRHAGQIQTTSYADKVLLEHGHTHLCGTCHLSCFHTIWQSWLVTTESGRPTNLQILTTCPLQKETAEPWSTPFLGRDLPVPLCLRCGLWAEAWRLCLDTFQIPRC